MYKYKFVNRDRIVFTCDADHMTDALMKFNCWKREFGPHVPYNVINEFHHMCIVENGAFKYGVTWSENK